METVDFLVKFLSKGQSGGGGAGSAGDAASDAANNAASTGDFASILLLVAALLAVAVAFCYAYYKKHQAASAIGSHNRASVNDCSKSIFSSNKILFVAVGIIAAICIACAFGFGGVKNAIADTASKLFQATNVEYSYSTDKAAWVNTSSCISNLSEADASVTNLHIEKMADADDKGISWKIGEAGSQNYWYSGTIDQSVDASISGVDIKKASNIYVSVESDELTTEIADSLAGKDLFTITTSMQVDLTPYKQQAVEAVEYDQSEAVAYAKTLNLLDGETSTSNDDPDPTIKEVIENINASANDAIEKINQALDKDGVDKAKNEGIDSILNDCKYPTQVSIGVYDVACDFIIMYIEGLSQERIEYYQGLITDIDNEACAKVDSVALLDDLIKLNTDTQLAMDKVVDDARAEATKEAKEIAINTVNSTYDAAVESLNGLPGLYNDDVERQMENLNTAKETALSSIDSAVSLGQIREALSQYSEDVEDVSNESCTLSDAKVNARNAIRSSYNTTYTAINSSNLSIDEKSKLSSELEAKYDESLEALKSAATADAALQAKEVVVSEAKEIVSNNPTIFDNYKDAAKQSLDSNLNLNKESVNNLSNLTSAEKENAVYTLVTSTSNAKTQINAITEVSDLDKIYEIATNNQASQFDTVKDAAKTDIDNNKNKTIDEINSISGLSEQDKQNAIDEVKDKADSDIESIDKLSADSTPTDRLSEISSEFTSSTSALINTEKNYGQTKTDTIAAINDKADADVAVIEQSSMSSEEKEKAKTKIEKAREKALEAVEIAEDISSTQAAKTDMDAACDKVIDDNDLVDSIKTNAVLDVQQIENDALNALGNLSYISEDQKETCKQKIIEIYESYKTEITEASSASDVTAYINSANSEIMEQVKTAANSSIETIEAQAKDRVTTEFIGLSEKDENRYNSDLSTKAITDKATVTAASNFSDIVQAANNYVGEASNTMVDAEAISDTKINSMDLMYSHYNACKAAIEKSSTLADDQKTYAKETLENQYTVNSTYVMDEASSVSDVNNQVNNFDVAINYIIDIDTSGELLKTFASLICDDAKKIMEDTDSKVAYLSKNLYITSEQETLIKNELSAAYTQFEVAVASAAKASDITDAQYALNVNINNTIKEACHYGVSNVTDLATASIAALNLSDSVKQVYLNEINSYKTSCDSSINNAYSTDRSVDNLDQYVNLAVSVVESAKALDTKVTSAKDEISSLQVSSKNDVNNLKNITDAAKSEYNTSIDGVASSSLLKLDAATNDYDVDSIVALASEKYKTIVDTAKASDEKSYWKVTFNMGGHGQAPADQAKKYGELVDKPADPTAEGYEFKGWFKDSALTQAWDFNADKVGDIASPDCVTTIYAKWEGGEPATHTIYFKSKPDNVGHVECNGQTISELKNLSENTAFEVDGNSLFIIDSGLGYSLSAVANEGYSFVNWEGIPEKLLSDVTITVNFKGSAAPDAYAYLTSTDGVKTMHFTYDDQSGKRTEPVYRLNRFTTDDEYSEGIVDTPGWLDQDSGQVKQQFDKVIFESSFASYQPETLAFWFYGQENLQITDDTFNNLNLSSCLDMSGLFTLSSISDFSFSMFKYKPVKLYRFAMVFADCENLTSVDLTNIDLSNLESELSIASLFYGCSSLKNIKCDQYLSKYYDGEEGYCYDVFEGCDSLTGGQGTTYSDEHMSAEYARPDDVAGGKPGYFTGKVATPDAYACLNGDTLTFYYDYDKGSRSGNKWELNTGDSRPGWTSGAQYFQAIRKVVFDSSFKDCQPTSCSQWFYQCNNLTTIENMNNLNTSKVTHMNRMFFQCMGITNLDFTSFDISNVIDMSDMLTRCSSLTTIYSNMNWSKNEKITSQSVFNGCSKLVGGQGTTYKDSNITGLYARPDMMQVGGDAGYFTSTATNGVANTENNSTATNEKSASESSDNSGALNNAKSAEENSNNFSSVEPKEQNAFEQANTNVFTENSNATDTESAAFETASAIDEIGTTCLSILDFSRSLITFAVFSLI